MRRSLYAAVHPALQRRLFRETTLVCDPNVVVSVANQIMEIMRAGVQSVHAEKSIFAMGCAVNYAITLRKHTIRSFNPREGNTFMNSIVYLVGAVVIILVILGFLGLR